MRISCQSSMRANRVNLNPQQISNWTHCAVVLCAVTAATMIRLPFQPIMHNASPFLFYLPVVVVVAAVLGPKFGLLATAASIFPANYFWMAPERAFNLDLTECCQILGFSFAGCSVSWLSDAARKRQQLEEHLRATLASIGDAILTVDCEGRIVYLNPMAQLLTELDGKQTTGCMIGTTLNLVSDVGQNPLSGKFQMAIKDDEIEHLPRRLVVISKTGKKCPVEQNTSRILDPQGRKIGMAILLRR
jgi:PAS domain S-box-containing protein